MSPASDAIPANKSPLSFLIFEPFFLTALALFPLFRGAVELWSFSLCMTLLCAAFSLYWFGRAFREPVPRSVLDPWIAVYIACFLVSAALSKIPYLSLAEIFKLGCVLCAFLAVRFLCRSRGQIYRLAQFLVLIGGFLSMVGLLQFAGGFPHDWWSHPKFLSSTYVNHNHFAGLLNLLLPVSLGLVVAERSRSKKALLLFMSVLMGVAMALALSRGALVSFGVSIVFMLLVLRKRRLISSGILPLLLFVGLVTGAVLIFGTTTIEQRINDIQRMTIEEEMSLKVRQFLWQGTLPMIRRFFWLGSGPGTFGHLFLQFRPPEFFSQRSSYALNDFLQLWAECGIFSFMAAGWLTLVFFRRGLRIIHADDSRLRIGLGAGILAGELGLLVHGLFNFNFHIPANWLLSAVAAGLLLAMDDAEYYRPVLPGLAAKTAVSFILLFVFVSSLYFGLASYRFWEARELFRAGETKSALEAVEKSIKLNPLDPEPYYLRGFMRPPGDTRAAADDFDKAIRRNRYEPVYDMAKARRLTPILAQNSPAELTALFKNAVQKDPNNHDLVSIVVRESFGRRDPRFSAFTEQVGLMLEQDPRTLGGLVAGLEGQDLWQHHRKFHLKFLGEDPDALKRELPYELWNKLPAARVLSLADFSQPPGPPLFEGSNFFRNGEVTKNIKVHNHLVLLVLRAKGNRVGNGYPTLYVKIDGKVVDEYYVDSKTYKNYYTGLKLQPGEHVLSLQYVNDYCIGQLPSEDRNVWVQKIYFLEPD